MFKTGSNYSTAMSGRNKKSKTYIAETLAAMNDIGRVPEKGFRTEGPNNKR